jgi:hypothetical protein
MNERFTKWDAVHELKSEEDIALYFEACLDDDPGDGSLIRAALGDIARIFGAEASARRLTSLCGLGSGHLTGSPMPAAEDRSPAATQIRLLEIMLRARVPPFRATD